jgi:hypothetical protein
MPARRPAAGQPCATRVQHGLPQAERAGLIGIRGTQAAAVISELDVIVTPHPRQADRKGRAAMRRARAAALARGAFSSARIFHAALGTGQRHDGPRTSSPSRSHVTAGTAGTTPIPFQELNQMAGAFQPEDLLVYRGAVLARHLTGTAPRRPRRLRPSGSLEIPSSAATTSPRRSPSTSECPGTGDPATQRAHASLVHRTAHTGEASRRIVSIQAGPSDSRSRQIKKRRTRRYAWPVATRHHLTHVYRTAAR